MRSGLISFSCEQCRSASVKDASGKEISNYIKENRGCESPTQTPAKWLDDDEEWYNCPIRFISLSVVDFFEKYDAYKNGLATPPDYEKQAAKFNEAIIVFQKYLDKYVAVKQGKK